MREMSALEGTWAVSARRPGKDLGKTQDIDAGKTLGCTVGNGVALKRLRATSR